MPHLNAETLARLVDEAAEPAEREHLESCTQCRQDLEDMRADVATLHSLPPLEPPPNEWDAIAGRLAAEGLVQSRRHISWHGAALRLAAAIAIFLLGSLTGIAWTRAERTAPVMQTAQAPAAEPNSVATVQPAPAPIEAVPQPTIATAVATDTNPTGDARPDSRLASSLLDREPATPEEAAAFLRDVESLYYYALTRMAEVNQMEATGDPVTRLAALEGIATITRTALGQAPADPVLNGYHLTALAERDATLRQIAATDSDRWF